MTRRNEGARDAEPAVEAGEGAQAARWSPRTRAISEAVVAALSGEPLRPRTRVVSEAVAAAIPAEAEGGDAEPGAGA